MKSNNPSAVRLVSILFGTAVLAAGANSASAQTKVVISAARSYDLVGPVRYETQFEQMAGFNSPTLSGSAPDGAFVFLPKSASSSGGVIQIKFVDLRAAFSAECEVGNSGQAFEIVLSDGSPGGGVEKLNASSGVVGTKNIVSFVSKPMYARGDFLIRIASATAPRDWNLTRCEVTVSDVPAAQKVPKAPDVRVQ